MKIIELEQMSLVSGGDRLSTICTAFNVGSAAYGTGILLNWWNPIGQIGSAILLVANIGCLAYSANH
jgi:hypothetical protein